MHRSLLLFILTLLCFPFLVQAQSPAFIHAEIGTGIRDRWEIAGNMTLDREIKRRSITFSEIEWLRLEEDEDKLLIEEVENFIPPALPLLEFKAERKEGGVYIHGMGPTSLPGYTFYLQKSRNAKDWKNIHEFPEAHKEASIFQFSFQDKQAQVGSNYYRLERIDPEGKQVFGDPIVVEVLPELTHMTYLYPSPLIFGTLIELDLYKVAQVEIKVLDLEKKILGTLFSDLCSLGEHRIELNLNGLPKGEYLCEIRVGKRLSVRRLRK